jgi:hypothetical protein
MRCGLALAAVGAAYFIMSDPWPAELAGRLFDAAPHGSVPQQMGPMFASLR